jgi:REP element-mobilizing transposase RayT
MPRGARLDAPGVAHHVMFRGIERRDIFLDDADRERFLRRAGRLLPELGFLCFAWVLMPNHVHLVVQRRRVGLSRLMARLCTAYAVYFNARHDRAGHVFQNRFRSRIVRDDEDLRGLVVYVSRNPLRAGLVRDAPSLAGYPWCGYGALVGTREPHPFEATRETLRLFAPGVRTARSRLAARIARGESRIEPWRAGAEAAERAVERRDAARQLRDATLREIVAEEAEARGLSTRDLLSHRRSRAISAARAAIASRAVRQLGYPSARVAEALGTSRAAISLMLRRHGLERRDS